MSLKQQIGEDMKAAMKARDSVRLSAIRMLLAAVKQREVDSQGTADDAAIIALTEKAIKQRRDAAEQFAAAGREELAAKERAEIEALSAYLPAQLDEREIDKLVEQTVADCGASGPADMGKVMGALKPALAGKADMKLVSARVRQSLAKR